MLKYGSIDQFRQVIREVRTYHDYKGKDADGNPIYGHDSPYPILQFEGTVKLHGTNASIVLYKDRGIVFQSRNRELTVQNDNMGFAMAMSAKNLDELFEGIDFEEYIAIYGEWIGEGVQSGVAVSQLSRRFVIFGCNVDWTWVPYDKSFPEMDIYNIHDFPTYKVTIDFNSPELVQNKLIEITEAIEKECPVGAAFGIFGVGEGAVWRCTTNPGLGFKVKGTEHSVSKVKTLASVDTEAIENVNIFVDNVLTEQRLQQGLDYVKEMFGDVDVKRTGDFLRWMVNDVHKEEQDTIILNQFNVGALNKALSAKARQWWMQQV